MSDVLDRLRKLAALADRGIGGEKENAVRMLSDLMQKYGINPDSISETTLKLRWFKFNKGEHQRRLLRQVIGSIIRPPDIYVTKFYRNCLGAYCTKEQAIDIEFRYSIFSKDLEYALDLCLSAFIQTNMIFHPEAPSSDPREDSEEDLKRLGLAMLSIKKSEVRKAIA